MKKKKNIVTVLGLIVVLIGALLYSLTMSAQDNIKTETSTKTDGNPDIKNWPEASRKAAKEMMDKYGLPNASTPDMLVWNNNGVWLKTIVYKKEMKHDFPMAHTDVLEQWINYRIPLDKYDEIASYDGSVTINRTNGTISARCDKEAMNILALNLAYDVSAGIKSVTQAREDYNKNAMAFKKGDKPAYVQSLNFDSDRSAPDPDMPYTMGSKELIGADGSAEK